MSNDNVKDEDGVLLKINDEVLEAVLPEEVLLDGEDDVIFPVLVAEDDDEVDVAFRDAEDSL